LVEVGTLRVGRRTRGAAFGVVAVAISMAGFMSAANAADFGPARPPAHTSSVPDFGVAVSISQGGTPSEQQRVGTYSGLPAIMTIYSVGVRPVVITDIFSSSHDFFGSTNCFEHASIPVGASCTVKVYFFPTAAGPRHDTLQIVDNAPDSPQKIALGGEGIEGYYVAGAQGQVVPFGDAVLHGDANKIGLRAPVISIKATANGDGYWLLAADGGIFSFGNAKFFGSTGNIRLNQPIVGMERTLSGNGYWLVASDGGIFAFGDAEFFGSTGNIRLNQPVVGMARTATGHGYWLVARDGGVFAFGDAKFFGSTGNIRLNQPIVGIVPRPTAKGYWMHAADGGIFAFGDAPFLGTATAAPDSTIVDMAATPDGRGYWLVANDTVVHHFGNAAAFDQLPGFVRFPAVGIAPTSPPLTLALARALS
jgi:hypothetical protein